MLTCYQLDPKDKFQWNLHQSEIILIKKMYLKILSKMRLIWFQPQLQDTKAVEKEVRGMIYLVNWTIFDSLAPGRF